MRCRDLRREHGKLNLKNPTTFGFPLLDILMHLISRRHPISSSLHARHLVVAIPTSNMRSGSPQLPIHSPHAMQRLTIQPLEVLEVARAIRPMRVAYLRCEIGVIEHVSLGLEEINLFEKAGDFGLGVNGASEADGSGVEACSYGEDEGENAGEAGSNGEGTILGHYDGNGVLDGVFS